MSVLVSASIVLYETKCHDLLDVISSYAPAQNRKLFLVDNSPTLFELSGLLNNSNIEYTFVGRNLGYGAAHNIAIRKAMAMGSKYHVILNPDVSFDSTIIDQLVQRLDADEAIGMAMPRIVNLKGELQYNCKLVPVPTDLIFRRFLPCLANKKRVERFQLKFADYEKEMDVPYLSGCFMFLRTEALQKIGLFDERFFMYPEDIDLTRRMYAEYRTLYYPKVQVVHAHAAESYKSLRMLWIHIWNTIKYFNKWGWVFDSERRRINKEVLKALNYKEKTNQ